MKMVIKRRLAMRTFFKSYLSPSFYFYLFTEIKSREFKMRTNIDDRKTSDWSRFLFQVIMTISSYLHLNRRELTAA